MATTRSGSRRRAPLSRERVLRAALRLADEQGIDAVSMRKVGQLLRVEAMSLYKHVSGKEDVLDGIVDLVMAEVVVPSPEADWRTALRASAISVHEALLRHPWAGAVIEARRNPGPQRLRYLDAVVGVLRNAGFTMPMVARAFMALDSHTYGFAMQELSTPLGPTEGAELAAAMARDVFAGRYPNLVAMAELAASGSVPIDFEFGLDLLLDGLERVRAPI